MSRELGILIADIGEYFMTHRTLDRDRYRFTVCGGNIAEPFRGIEVIIGEDSVQLWSVVEDERSPDRIAYIGDPHGIIEDITLPLRESNHHATLLSVCNLLERVNKSIK